MKKNTLKKFGDHYFTVLPKVHVGLTPRRDIFAVCVSRNEFIPKEVGYSSFAKLTL